MAFTKSLYGPSKTQDHTKDALYFAGLEANGMPDALGNKDLMSMIVLYTETETEMQSGDFQMVKLVFPKKDARRIASQILAAAEGPLRIT